MDRARKTICFDLDGTLCTNTGGDYASAQPVPWAIERVNALARAGHGIVIFTARGSATGIDWEQVTRDQLERWGVSYDELRLGKPSADVFVDDRAVHTEAWRSADAFAVPGYKGSAILTESDGERDVFAGDLPFVPPPHLSAITEAGRTFDGRPFLVERHAERALRLAAAAGIPAPEAPEIVAEVESAVEIAAESTSGGELVFTIALMATAHAAYLDVWDPLLPTGLHVSMRSLAEAETALRRFVVEPGTDGPPAVAATTSPGDAAAWPLRTRADGSLGDALGGELAAAAGDRLALSPEAEPRPVASGRLRELAGRLGLDLEERPLTEDDLSAADEAFVVGLPFCVVPLAKIDGRAAGTGRTGPLARRLLDSWVGS